MTGSRSAGFVNVVPMWYLMLWRKMMNWSALFPLSRRVPSMARSSSFPLNRPCAWVVVPLAFVIVEWGRFPRRFKFVRWVELFVVDRLVDRSGVNGAWDAVVTDDVVLVDDIVSEKTV